MGLEANVRARVGRICEDEMSYVMSMGSRRTCARRAFLVISMDMMRPLPSYLSLYEDLITLSRVPREMVSCTLRTVDK